MGLPAATSAQIEKVAMQSQEVSPAQMEKTHHIDHHRYKFHVKNLKLLVLPVAENVCIAPAGAKIVAAQISKIVSKTQMFLLKSRQNYDVCLKFPPKPNVFFTRIFFHKFLGQHTEYAALTESDSHRASCNYFVPFNIYIFSRLLTIF